ncbi:MAG: tetratricopeptide repeat protein [Turneriella sp.]|nr:tetratricopeptide repeat protein [Turneriella sp.]
MIYAALAGIVVLTALLLYLLTLRKTNPFHTIQQLMDDGQYTQAVELLNDLVDDVDLAPRAYLYLAECQEQLGAPEQARENYRKAIDAGAFEDREREIEIYKKIAEIYRSENDYNGYFETCLEILRLNPQDQLANQEVGLILLGEGQFHLAERYLRASLQISTDPQLVAAHAVALWQLGEHDAAISELEPLVTAGESDGNVELLYAAMANYGPHLARGKQVSLRLIEKCSDDNLLVLLINLYLYQCYQARTPRDAIDLLRRYYDSDTLPVEHRLEYRYLLLVLYLHEEMFLEASRHFREVADSAPDYRDLRHLKIMIDQIDLKPHAENLKPFDEIYKESFESLLQPDLVYGLSGFRRNRGIMLDRFFDFSGATPQLRVEYDILTAERASGLFLQMLPEEFQRFVNFIIAKLEYHEPVKESSGEKDLVLYSAISAKNRSIRALFAFYRLRTDSHLSDISIRNLQNRMQTLRADKTYLISPAQLTEGALALLKDASSLRHFGPEQLTEWLHEFYKSARSY